MTSEARSLGIGNLRDIPFSKQLFFHGPAGLKMADCETTTPHFPHIHFGFTVVEEVTVKLSDARLCAGVDSHNCRRKHVSDFSLSPRGLAATYAALGSATSYFGKPQAFAFSYLPIAIRRLAADVGDKGKTVDQKTDKPAAVGTELNISDPEDEIADSDSELEGEFAHHEGIMLEAPGVEIELEDDAAAAVAAVPTATLIVRPSSLENGNRYLTGAVISRVSDAARIALLGGRPPTCYVAIDYAKITTETDAIAFLELEDEGGVIGARDSAKSAAKRTQKQKSGLAAAEGSETAPEKDYPPEQDKSVKEPKAKVASAAERARAARAAAAKKAK
jgi:hypothetical protein